MRLGSKKIRVLVVDDSASVRQALTAIIDAAPDMMVMGTAGDPFAAAKLIHEEVPDVIILDVEMPRMDGLTFLRKLMAQRPIPCVLCSTLLESGSDIYLDALEAGAVEIIQKPRVDTKQFFQESQARVCEALRAAAGASLRARTPATRTVQKKLSADVIMPAPARPRGLQRTTDQVVCIGASTGGTESLREVLTALPADSPGIVIVQHMPEKFTAAFAKRLDGLCQIDVKEAEDGDAVLPGRALIAPGNRHMLLQRSGARYYVSIKDGPLVARHRPSVDHDRHGRRRRARSVGNEDRWRRHHRAERGDLRRLRHAEGGHCARRSLQDRPPFRHSRRDPQCSLSDLNNRRRRPSTC